MRHKFLVSIIFILGLAFTAEAKEIINIKNAEGDMTQVLRDKLNAIQDKEVKIIFEKGTYLFMPTYAMDKYCFITNHGNGLKKIIFRFENFTSVEIEGNGAKFIFHGQEAPFQFEKCKNVSVKNITIDWDVPFSFQGDVLKVNKQENWIDIKPYTKGFSWKLAKGRIMFPNIDGFHFDELGSTLEFDKKSKAVGHGAWDFGSRPRWVEKRPNGVLRIHEERKYYPKVGTVLHSKGGHGQNRYAPAFQVTTSSNIIFDQITIHHALGMGFLFERTDGISILNSNIVLPENSDRVVSTIADATHFANCKGAILIENCRFENMLDDGTNVHGTYVSVDQIINSKTVRVKLQHFEQMGFVFAEADDEVWFIQNPDPSRGALNKVVKVNYVNDRFTDLSFEYEIPQNLAVGDILENKTWNPEFTMRGCTIRNHRARNIIFKTPLKVVIEDNDLSSMMSSILLRGESYFWYESGAVGDVLIQNNRFKYCAYSGSEHAVLRVTPRMGASFDQSITYDKNIRFVNNTIENFDKRVVWADRAEGLLIEGNTITKTNDAVSLYPNAPVFEFENCKDVKLYKNKYIGKVKNTIMVKTDAVSEENIVVKRNKGFK